jgi:hypothetical protein
VVLTVEPEAEAAPEKPVAPKIQRAPRPTSTPIVAKPVSKFTVTVEYVTLVPPATPPAEGAATPPNS